MKKLIFLILSFSISVVLPAQQKVNSVSEKQREINSQCVFTGKYSSTKILSSFPFKEAAVIKLISFSNPEDAGIIKAHGHKTNDDIFIIDSVSIDSSSWKVIKVLPRTHYLTLGNLIFNYSFKGKNSLVEMAMCYRPHHAIVFYNRDGNLLAVIEICFECGRIQTYPDNFSIGDACSNKLDLYKKLLEIRRKCIHFD